MAYMFVAVLAVPAESVYYSEGCTVGSRTLCFSVQELEMLHPPTAMQKDISFIYTQCGEPLGMEIMLRKYPVRTYNSTIHFVAFSYIIKRRALDFLVTIVKFSPFGWKYGRSSGLHWRTRYKIIEGTCYGLCHLHEQVDKHIIHLDLKPANILLDDGMVPKITDFGLSRLLDQQQTICTSSRVGTPGYMAPEFVDRGTITPMSDIFSLGVIIMEVVTGHRDYPDVTRESSDKYIELALKKWRDVLQRESVHGSLETDCEQINRCIQIGLICVNPDRKKRPPITKVISMLQGSDIIDCGISNEDA